MSRIAASLSPDEKLNGNWLLRTNTRRNYKAIGIIRIIIRVNVLIHARDGFRSSSSVIKGERGMRPILRREAMRSSGASHLSPSYFTFKSSTTTMWLDRWHKWIFRCEILILRNSSSFLHRLITLYHYVYNVLFLADRKGHATVQTAEVQIDRTSASATGEKRSINRRVAISSFILERWDLHENRAGNQEIIESRTSANRYIAAPLPA